MARGSDNYPEHFDETKKNQFVLYEQDSHRDVSRGTKGATGVTSKGGEAGPHWQSHHIICLQAMSEIPDKTTLRQALEATIWNINEEPNMIGLPTRAWYRKAYSDEIFSPVNIPSHNNDHGFYLTEVKNHIKNTIWNKFKPSKEGHATDGENIAQELKDASKYFEGELETRGGRNQGTRHSWETRLDNNEDPAARRASEKASSPGQEKGNLWYFPFSMAIVPKRRSPGQDPKDLTWLFDSDFWR